MPLRLGGRGALGVGGDGGEPIGDGAGVLHRAGLEVRHADRVDLGVRVRDRGVVLEVLERAGVGVARVDALVRHAPRQEDAHRPTGGRLRHRRRLVGADGVGDQVRRDRRRLRELDLLAAAAEVGLARHRPVRDRHQVRGDIEGQGEAGLELGLVEAGEGAAGVGGLELGGGVAGAVLRRAVEAAQAGEDLAAEVEAEAQGAGRQRARETSASRSRRPRCRSSRPVSWVPSASTARALVIASSLAWRVMVAVDSATFSSISSTPWKRQWSRSTSMARS